MDKIRLRIFAYHVYTLAISPPGSTFGLNPCNGVSVQVRIEKSQKSPNDREWDQVYIEEKLVGNRHAAVRRFTEMVKAACDGIHPDND